MQKNKRNILIIAIIILVGLLSLFFIIRLKNKAPEETAETGLGVAVETEAVKKEDFEIIYNYSGRVEYKDKKKISPRIGGEIREIYLREGEEIKKGELLAKIDDREIKNNLSTAQAALQEAELMLKKAELSHENAVNNLNESKAALKEAASDFKQWQSDYRRDQKLYQADAIAKAKFEQTETQYLKSKARLERTEAAHKTAKNAVTIAAVDIENSKKRIERSQNEVDNAKLQISYTEIRAEIDGKLLEQYAEKGEMISSMQPLFATAVSEKIEIKSYVSMKDIVNLKPGSELRVYFSAFPAKNFKTTIKEISPISNPQTMTTEVTAVLANLEAEIRDGMTAEVDFVAERKKDVLLIPNQAVFNYLAEAHVYKIENGRAHRIKIATGMTDGNYTVVKSGVKEDDILAVSNINNLRDGVKVYLPQKENGAD